MVFTKGIKEVMIVIWNDPEDIIWNSWEEPPNGSGSISQLSYEVLEEEVIKNPIGFIWEKDKTDEIN